MRTVSVRELQSSIKQCVQYSQKDRIVITQHGEPSAVIIGVKGMDWESVVMETSAPFWKMVRKRRGQPTLSLAEARSRIAAGRRKNGKTDIDRRQSNRWNETSHCRKALGRVRPARR